MTDPVISTVDFNALAKEIADQAAQTAAQQAAAQVAQQISEQISQAVSQAVQKFMQTTGTSTVASKTEFADIGGSERLERDQMADSGFLFANNKRTADEYQHESLESNRRNRAYVDKVLSDAQTNTGNVNTVSLQALQNAVETANLVGKAAVKASEIATDGLWNPVQQGAGDTLTARAVSLDDASLKAIGAQVANVLSQVQPKV